MNWMTNERGSRAPIPLSPVAFPVKACLHLQILDRKLLIFWERTGHRLLWALIWQQITWLRNYPARNPCNISTVPLEFLWLLCQPDRHVWYADPTERIPRDPLESGSHGHVLSDHIPVVYVLNDGNSIGVIVVVGMGTIVAGHPEHPLHSFHGHSTNVDVLHIPSSPNSCLDPDPGLRVDGHDVLCPDILDPTWHLAAQCNHCARGGNACEPPDDEMLGGHPVGYSILVPATLDCHTVISGDNVTVFNSCVRAGVYNHID